MESMMIQRITVEQEPDWLRVQDNITKGLAESLELRLASLPGGKDGTMGKAMKMELEARIAKLREEVFNAAKPNLRVNGYEYENYLPATEPWDENLDRNVDAQAAQRVAAEMENAEQRRKVPKEVKANTKQVENQKAMREYYEPEQPERIPLRDCEVPHPPRHQETKEAFNTVVANLVEIHNIAPQLSARAQRAQSVREEIANLGP